MVAFGGIVEVGGVRDPLLLPLPDGTAEDRRRGAGGVARRRPALARSRSFHLYDDWWWWCEVLERCRGRKGGMLQRVSLSS